MKPPHPPAGHGAPPALCGSRRRQSDGTCRKPAGWGTSHAGYGHCRLHGGNTPNQVVAARRLRAESQARQLLADLGAAPVGDPLAELLLLAGEVVAFKDATRRLAERLESIRYESDGGGEQLRAEIALYERALDRAVSVLGAVARLDIDGRLVRIEEEKAAVFAAALERGLSEADVPAPQAARVKRATARYLRASQRAGPAAA